MKVARIFWTEFLDCLTGRRLFFWLLMQVGAKSENFWKKRFIKGWINAKVAVLVAYAFSFDAAMAFTAPGDNTAFGYGIYDFLVNTIANGPLGYTIAAVFLGMGGVLVAKNQAVPAFGSAAGAYAIAKLEDLVNAVGVNF